MRTPVPASTSNMFARIAGRDDPASHVLQRAIVAGTPLSMESSPRDDDYALIEPTLDVADLPDEFSEDVEYEPVTPGIGYAGMTPRQRAAFLAWLSAPAELAPVAFQDLYVAQLEARLLEGGALGEEALSHLRILYTGPEWQGNVALVRAILLGHWLAQDGEGLRDWLTQAPLPTRLLDRGLGLQALLQTPLTVGEVTKMGTVWNLPALTADENTVRMRLASLTTHLNADPLAYTLDALDEAAKEPCTWRSAHRGLRFSLPQPSLRPPLESLFADLATIQAVELPEGASDFEKLEEEGRLVTDGAEGTIILEFGASRSEYFDYVLQLAQRLDGYRQIMDEDRRLIYRVRFHKAKLRKFWRIWEYVQKWSSTRIYVDGEEIEHWKVWPYSQYLR